MKRSTNMAPVSLSTSYFTGSLCEGISIMTLISLGTSLPDVTRSRFMMALVGCEKSAHFTQTGGKLTRRRIGERRSWAWWGGDGVGGIAGVRRVRYSRRPEPAGRYAG